MKTTSLLGVVVILLAAPSLPVAAAEPDFGKWEKEISAYEQADRDHPPPQGAILFTGASNIRLWKTLSEDFPQHKVINRGFGGSQIVDATHFAERIIFPYKPRMIVFRSGGNDLNAGKTPEQVFADFQAFVEKVHAKLPETDILYISQSPSIARWKQVEKERELNALVKKLISDNPHLKYIDVFDMVLGADGKPRADVFVADGLHFSVAGYKLLAERVRPHLPK